MIEFMKSHPPPPGFIEFMKHKSMAQNATDTTTAPVAKTAAPVAATTASATPAATPTPSTADPVKIAEIETKLTGLYA